MKIYWIGLSVFLLAVAGCAYVLLFGSAVVRDETGEVVSAVITDDHREQAMTRLPGGIFFAIPDVEGTIEVRCRNGSSARAGYVHGSMHTSVRVVGDTRCGRIIEEL